MLCPTSTRRLARVGLLLTGALVITPSLALSGSHPDRKSDRLADVLDNVIQARFQADGGNFGTERIEVTGHNSLDAFTHMSGAEKAAFGEANRIGREYVIGFSHFRHRRGVFLPPSSKNPGSVTGSVSAGAVFAALVLHVGGTTMESGSEDPAFFDWEDRYDSTIERRVRSAMGRTIRGVPTTSSTTRWTITVRPIRALRRSCVNCHVGSKMGDTFGAMVYVVRRNGH